MAKGFLNAAWQSVASDVPTVMLALYGVDASSPQAQAVIDRFENPWAVGDSRAEKASAIFGEFSAQVITAYSAGRGAIRAAGASLKETLTPTLRRSEAFNEAKERAGIPRSAQPVAQWQVGGNYYRDGFKNYVYKANKSMHGRFYLYNTERGERVIVEHYYSGGPGNPPKPHFHVGKPPEGFNGRTYDFRNEPYKNLESDGLDRHIWYNPD